jgi:hypothetical protein
MQVMYATAGWENFFVAEVGASAALLGLLFVAVSISLAKVLEYRHLPGRAAEALIVLIAVLVTSTCCLIPGQSPLVLGAEITAMGAIAWLMPMRLQIRNSHQPGVRRWWVINRIVLTQLSSLPMLAAGISLIAERGGGLYWLVPGVVCSFATAIFGGWVLLVEVNR